MGDYYGAWEQATAEEQRRKDNRPWNRLGRALLALWIRAVHGVR